MEYFWKIDIKKTHKTQIGHVSNNKTNSESKLRFSKNSFKFIKIQLMWVHNRRIHLIQPSAPLPATRRAQRVNDEPWSCSFCLFLLEVNSNYNETAIFYFWIKAIPVVNPSSLGILSKIDIKKLPKKPTLNSHISNIMSQKKSLNLLFFVYFL